MLVPNLVFRDKPRVRPPSIKSGFHTFDLQFLVGLLSIEIVWDSVSEDAPIPKLKLIYPNRLMPTPDPFRCNGTIPVWGQCSDQKARVQDSDSSTNFFPRRKKWKMEAKLYSLMSLAWFYFILSLFLAKVMDLFLGTKRWLPKRLFKKRASRRSTSFYRG